MDFQPMATLFLLPRSARSATADRLARSAKSVLIKTLFRHSLLLMPPSPVFWKAFFEEKIKIFKKHCHFA
jgi:hypothetical protein